MDAYADAIAATSTKHAPWFIVPANSRLQRNLIVSSAICDALEGMNMHYPEPAPYLENIVVT